MDGAEEDGDSGTEPEEGAGRLLATQTQVRRYGRRGERGPGAGMKRVRGARNTVEVAKAATIGLADIKPMRSERLGKRLKRLLARDRMRSYGRDESGVINSVTLRRAQSRLSDVERRGTVRWVVTSPVLSTVLFWPSIHSYCTVLYCSTVLLIVLRM